MKKLISIGAGLLVAILVVGLWFQANNTLEMKKGEQFIELDEYYKETIREEMTQLVDDSKVRSESLVAEELIQEETTTMLFLLRVLDGELVVYENETGLIYLKTGISVSALSEKERQEIEEGKYVENEEKLFSILETYTS